MKKCSGVPNPTTSQRQQMLRRNPLDIGRTSAQLTLPHLPGIMAAAAAAAGGGRHVEQLPPLPPASRLIYEQQSLNLLQQSLGGGQGLVGGPPAMPQLSPGHPRGQVPIESLLLHLNVGRSRHPSQSSVHSGAPPSPTSGMSFPDLQMMLRNAAAAAAVSSGSRQASGAPGPRSYPSPPSPGSSSSNPSATVTTSGMIPIPGMASFGGVALSPSSVTNARRSSPPHGMIGERGHPEHVPPPALSPIMSINPSLALAGYGDRGQMDSNAMPPPSTNGTVLRNISTTAGIIPPEMLSPTASSILRVDTRSLDGFPALSPPDKTVNRQGRVVPNPMASPRRKQPSPSSLSAGGSYIPLSTLESAAIASGLRSPSQVVRFLSNALREAENPLPPSNPTSSNYTRLPSLSHHNVLEAMVAAAAAEQNAAVTLASSPPSGGTRVRQVPSPTRYHHQPQHQHSAAPHPSSFQFSGELPSLPSLHMSQQAGVPSPEPMHQSSPGQHGVSHSPYSVITSSNLLQQQQQQQGLQQQTLSNARFTSASSAPSASRLASAMDEHHVGASQPQQIELHHHQQQSSQIRQHGYHQSLLLSHVAQHGAVSAQTTSSVYSTSPNGNGGGGYSTFSHSIVRSRSHSPGSVEHLRERDQDYQN